MEKILFLTYLILTSIFSNAQSVNLKLLNAQSIKIKDNILVCGIDDSQGKTRAFKAILYDNKLNQIKQFSKELSIAASGDKSYSTFKLDESSGVIVVTFLDSKVFKFIHYYLKLDSDLKELSFSPLNMDDYKKNEELNNKNGYYTLGKTNFFSTAVNQDHNYLGNDCLALKYQDKGGVKILSPEDFGINPLISPILFEPKFADINSKDGSFIIRFSPVPSKYENVYSAKWTTPIDEKDIAFGQYVHIDEDITIAVITAREKNKITNSFIYYLDSETGKIIRKTEIKPIDVNTSFYFTKGFYDTKNQNLIVSGNLIESDYKDRDKIKVKNVGVFEYDGTGKMLVSKKIDLVDLKTKEYKNFHLEYQFPIVKHIEKTEKGEFVIHAEILSQRFWKSAPASASAYGDAFGNANGSAGLMRWMPLALSSYELSSNLDITSNKIFYYDYSEMQDRDNVRYQQYYGASADGRRAVMSFFARKEHTARVINFIDNPSETDLVSKQTQEEDTDIDCKQFLINDHSIIVFSKTSDDEYELSASSF